MDKQIVKTAAREAHELARLEEDRAFQPAAYAVLFGRLLTLQLDANRDASSSHAKYVTAKPTVRSGRHAAKTGPLQRLRDLAEEGFFKTPRSLKDTLEELRQRGLSYDQAVAGKSLLRLVRERILRRTRRKEGGREFYSYTEW